MTARSIGAGTMAVFAFAVFLPCADGYADEPLCDFSSFHSCSLTDAGAAGGCLCDLTELRPLQGAVGAKEVEYKAAKIAKKPAKQCDKLFEEPIEVVVGPEGGLFITDHHHAAAAWLTTERERKAPALMAVCKIVNAKKGLPLAFASEDQFWQDMADKHLVWPYDKKGVKLASPSSDLPRTLDGLGDDPYRSLAWLVRETGGFCKDDDQDSNIQKEFLEFRWADFFRDKKVEVERVLLWDPEEDDPIVRQADDLAHSPEAATLPGYTKEKCPKPPKH